MIMKLGDLTVMLMIFEVINHCLKMNENKIKFNIFNVGSNKIIIEK